MHRCSGERRTCSCTGHLLRNECIALLEKELILPMARKALDAAAILKDLEKLARRFGCSFSPVMYFSASLAAFSLTGRKS